jgi:hypothetical protein
MPPWRIRRTRVDAVTHPRNHNRGPIGPLDPNEPPPWEPELKRDDVLDAYAAAAALRSMGMEIDAAAIKFFATVDGGLVHRAVAPLLLFRWGDVLDFVGRTSPPNLLNRKKALEYIRSRGVPLGDNQLVTFANCSRGPDHIIIGREAYYSIEDTDELEGLDTWIEKRKAMPTRSYAPKYKPRNATRRCPKDHPCGIGPKHRDCEKHNFALCNFAHLPDRPDS